MTFMITFMMTFMMTLMMTFMMTFMMNRMMIMRLGMIEIMVQQGHYMLVEVNLGGW